MIPFLILFVLIAMLLVQFLHKHAKSKFPSLATLYLTVWFFVLLLNLVPEFNFFELDENVSLMICLTVIGVLIGTLTSLRFAVAKDLAIQQPKQSDLISKITTLKYTTYFLAALALLVAVGTFLAISSLFGNPFDEGNGETIKNARVALGASFAGEASLLLKVSGLVKATIFFSLFMSISLSIYLQARPPVILMVSLLIASVLYDASVGSRTLLFDYLVLCLMGLFLHKRLANKRFKARSSIWGKFALFTVFVIGIGGGILITDSTRGVSGSTLVGVEVPYAIYQLALYYSSPIVLFSQVINEPHPTTYGLSSFGGVLGILNYLRITFENLWIYEIWTEWELSNPYFNYDSYYSRGNTYSWLRYMYSDWGYAGCVIIPSMVVHLGMTTIYQYKGPSRQSLTLIPYYLIAAFIIVKSPTMMIARNEEFFMIVILVFLTSIFLRLKDPSKASATS